MKNVALSIQDRSPSVCSTERSALCRSQLCSRGLQDAEFEDSHQSCQRLRFTETSGPYVLQQTQEPSHYSSCRIISFSSALRCIIRVLGSWVYPRAVEKYLCNVIQRYRTTSHPALILGRVFSCCLYLPAAEKHWQKDRSNSGDEHEGYI